MAEKQESRRHRLLFLGTGVYLLSVSTVMLRHNVWFSPDQFFFFALVGALFLSKGKSFIRDWIPFVLAFLSYEFMRGAIPSIAKFPVHSGDLIFLEQTLFHQIPTLTLQRLWLTPSLSWYDYVFTIAYISFFIAPLIMAFYLWHRDRPAFVRFSWTAVILFYLSCLTFIFFPSMPPWLAANNQLLPPLTRILYLTTAKMTISGSFPTIYNFFRANELAAIPSLHAAFPTVMFLVAYFSGKKILFVISLLYALVVYVGIVYFGEHYAIDAVAGIIYAAVSYVLAIQFLKQHKADYGKVTTSQPVVTG